MKNDNNKGPRFNVGGSIGVLPGPVAALNLVVGAQVTVEDRGYEGRLPQDEPAQPTGFDEFWAQLSQDPAAEQVLRSVGALTGGLPQAPARQAYVQVPTGCPGSVDYAFQDILPSSPTPLTVGVRAGFSSGNKQ